MKQLIRENKFILLFIVVALLAFALLTYFIILPAYTNSSSRLYTSKLGHPNILRKSGKPLPVKVTTPKAKNIEHFVMGEGVCASQPILVPIVPMAVVNEVLVSEGDTVTKGQVLATLESAKAQIKYDSAKLAVSTAEAELARVRLGSAYVLAQERPEVEKISLASLIQQQKYAKETLDKYEAAYKEGVISKVKILESRGEFARISEKLDQAQLSTKMAVSGVRQSVKIAENAVADTRQALAHRAEELKSFRVTAPADGVIDRVLINSGEYNQDSGKPGFLISSGLWFDAYFDQSDFPHVRKGLPVSVTLESYAGQEFPAQVAAIKPIVSFNSGGPEISRALRPRGSGSPEWAATFKVKLTFPKNKKTDGSNTASAANIITGMTGFARLRITRNSLTVPRSAVLSIAAGTGLAYVVTEDPEKKDEPKWEIRKVRIGQVNDTEAEILSGLTLNDQVMTDGHWTLKPEDKIEVER